MWQQVWGNLGLVVVLAGAGAHALAEPRLHAEPQVAVPDLARERRIAAQISDSILDGEPLHLQGADGHEFLAISTESAVQPVLGNLIILHGRGHHPDWINAIQPMRVGLAEHGWNTLSIQLPVLDASSKYYDYVEIFDAAMPRIEAAIEHARISDPGPVILIAHSCGAHMAHHWFVRRGTDAGSSIDGFIGIGMGATDYGQPMREPFALDRIKVPVLDLYAENDFGAVRRFAPQRWSMIASAGHPHSAQRVIGGAEHYFVDRGDDLVNVIADWLTGL